MSKLTRTAESTRKALKYGTIGFVAYLILRLILIGAVNLWKKLHPPSPPPPTVAFGQLSSIRFPQSVATGFNFKLETPTRGLPQFSNRAPVFFMSYKRASLLALDRAKQTADSLGFIDEPTAIDSENYSWTKQIPALLELRTNIVTGEFEINYQWQNDENILVEKNLPGNTQAIQEAKSYLEQANLLTDDLALGEIKVSYLKASANRLLPAVSLSEANFVKVDLFRKSVENIPLARSGSQLTSPLQKFPTVTPDPQNGIVSFIFSGSTNPQKRTVKLVYSYFPVTYESSSTYPLKNIAIAWEEVKNNQAYIAQVKEGISEIVIRKIYLGYYDDGPQEFFRPVYVFEGDDDFVAYTPAIDPVWTASQ